MTIIPSLGSLTSSPLSPAEPNEMEASRELELYGLRYSDLALLSSGGDAVSRLVSEAEASRLERVRASVVEALGPSGPGLISITGVPDDAVRLRRSLLLLSRKLALLPRDHRNRILKEHGLGSDVPLKNPDRSVSSFAAQLKYAQLVSRDGWEEGEAGGDEFRNLGDWFKRLGYWMMELGLGIARLCDAAIGGSELEMALLDSGSAKGRLIHYHSALDKLALRGSSGKKRSAKIGIERERGGSGLWQQWHYDYGIFTILTSPMFVQVNDFGKAGRDQERPYPEWHSCLQVYGPGENNARMVKTDPESFIVQVGESADILTKGKLRATLHCVDRPSNLDNVCRETFVVFLQPSWSRVFTVLDYPRERWLLDEEAYGGADGRAEDRSNAFSTQICKIVPPLSMRLKDGMTFAEFSRETTKQYYGGTGLQSNN